MVMLYREVIQVTWLELLGHIGLIVMVAVISVALFEMVNRSRQMPGWRKSILHMGIFLGAVLACIRVAHQFNHPIERVEALQHMDDFQASVHDAGWEIVERRGEIIVLERPYKNPFRKDDE